PKVIYQAYQLLVQQQPQVVLSFGGYVAVPIAIAAWFLNLPIVTHEQTRTLGLANRLISWLARYTAVSFQHTLATLEPTQAKLTGNPVRSSLKQQSKTRPSWLAKTRQPILMVMGGNQGSKIINQTIAAALPKLVQDWQVVHQCGNPTQKNHYQQELTKLQMQLPDHQQQYYQVRPWFTELELAWLYQHAKLVVSRAGANTIWELMTMKMPAILIPLPHARANEQQLNARYLADQGGAVLLPQSQLEAKTLLTTLTQAKSQLKLMRENLAQLDLPRQTSAQIYQLLIKALDESS
ncbi:MAG: hypothetical protein GF390_03130, partial [Candidatus Pacebacteria bacterium]|nr:hypothetical protein [Candidatus Paceibacterota bacterium]